MPQQPQSYQKRRNLLINSDSMSPLYPDIELQRKIWSVLRPVWMVESPRRLTVTSDLVKSIMLESKVACKLYLE